MLVNCGRTALPQWGPHPTAEGLEPRAVEGRVNSSLHLSRASTSSRLGHQPPGPQAGLSDPSSHPGSLSLHLHMGHLLE